jgi:hypothetical protein
MEHEMSTKTETNINYQSLLRMVTLAEKHDIQMDSWICYHDDDRDTFLPALKDYGDMDWEYITDLVCYSWENCGTVGCLAGTYTMAYPESIGVKSSDSVIEMWNDAGKGVIEELVAHLGISSNEANWLFLWERYKWSKEVNKVISHCHQLESVTGEKAINRLRKFIYFKLKQEEIHEAWNSRLHTKHAQSENVNCVLNTSKEYVNAV